MTDLKVALIQDAPTFMNIEKTLDKVEGLVSKAKHEGAELILFPEAFIGGYPRGLTFGTVVGSRTEDGRKLWQEYYDSALEEGSTAFDRLASIASNHETFLVIGAVEKVPSGTLYCSIFYFSPDGKFLGKHRKLKPTAAERIVWGEGDGMDLNVLSTPKGNIGGLICWENYMPLARTWLYQQNIEIYCAPTADHRDSWQHTLKHIALEGRCYVLGCNQFVKHSDYPDHIPGESLSELPETLTRGGSVIVDPMGEVVAGPLWDRSGILYADLSREKLIQSKMDFDVAGHYSRDDVFMLVNQKE